jgi:hypothetical protein
MPSRTQYLLRDARIIPLRDASARWQIGLAWQSDRDNAVVRRFVEFARAELARAIPGKTVNAPRTAQSRRPSSPPRAPRR